MAKSKKKEETPPGKSPSLSFTLPNEMREWLEEEARADDRTMGYLVRQGIEGLYRERYEGEPPWAS